MTFSITLIIIIFTCLVSYQALNNRTIFYRLEYTPYLVKHNKHYYRMGSHALVHADYMHLALNMYVLYVFGNSVEARFILQFGPFGKLIYLLFYIGGVFFASLPALWKHKDNAAYRAVGASGAVAAVLFAYILFNPTNTLYLFFSIPIKAWIFGILYMVWEYYMDKKSQDHIAHDAHYWGAFFGFLFPIVLEPSLFELFFQRLGLL